MGAWARRQVPRVAEAGIVVTALLLVASRLAPYHRLFDIAASFPAAGMCAATLCVLILLPYKRIAWVATGLVVALAQGVLVVPWYIPKPVPTSARRDLRVMTANLHYLNRQHERFIDLVLTEDPDLFMVGELTPEWFEGLRPLFARFPHYTAEPKKGVLRTGLFSKRPLENARMFWIVPDTYASIQAEIELAGQRVTVLATHAIPAFQIGFPPSRAEWAERRNATLAKVPDALSGVDGPCIFLGDHNATPWSPYYRRMANKAGLHNAREGFGVLPTWPTYFPPLMIPIDQCLYRGSIAAIGCRTSRRFGSDHLALIVDFALDLNARGGEAKASVSERTEPTWNAGGGGASQCPALPKSSFGPCVSL